MHSTLNTLLKKCILQKRDAFSLQEIIRRQAQKTGWQVQRAGGSLLGGMDETTVEAAGCGMGGDEK